MTPTTHGNLRASDKQMAVEPLVQIVIVVLMSLVAHDQVGLWVSMHKTTVIIGMGMYGAAFFLCHGNAKRTPTPYRAIAVLSLCCFYAVIIVFGDNALLVGLSILFYLVSRLAYCEASNRESKTLTQGLCVAVAVTSLYFFLTEHLMGAYWRMTSQVSVQLCHMMDAKIRFGPTAAMVNVTLYNLVFATSIFFASTRRPLSKYAAFGGISVLANLIYLRYAHLIHPRFWEIGLGQSEYDFGEFPIYSSLLEFVSMFDFALVYGSLLAILCGFWVFRSTPFRKIRESPPVPLGGLLTYLGATACLAMVCWLHTDHVTLSAWQSPRIGWYSQWDEGSPQYKESGYYGIAGTGMYGLFLDDLEKHGIDVVRLYPKEERKLSAVQSSGSSSGLARTNQDLDVETGRRDPNSGMLAYENIRDLDLLIFMVRTEPFLLSEQASLERYMREGGRVLVVGDHTNMEQCQIPFNQLAKPYHIKLEFDSAFSLISWWFFNVKQSLALPFVARTSNEYGIGTGGSLSIRSPACPLLVGKYAFGDLGNIFKNSRQEAFLGDYTYQHGEHLSDVVLAATAKAGLGKIVAFGDSSTFQNIAYAESRRFVRHLIAWMLDSSSRTFMRGRGSVVICFLLLLLLPLACNRHRLCQSFVVGACGASVILALSFRATGDEIPSHSARRCLLLRSHLSKINRDKFKKGSYLGLPLNLNRSGYDVEWIDKLDAETLQGSSLVMSPAPVRPLTRKEERLLDDYMKGGNHFVITAGHELSDVVDGLIEPYGLGIDDMPLGGDPFKLKDKTTPMFLNAWRIKCSSPHAFVLYKRLGEPVVVFRQVGKGGLVLVGDSQFFADGNLEEEKDYRVANINFLRTLLKRLQESRVTEISAESLKRDRHVAKRAVDDTHRHDR